jgi:hypothetical protein
MHLAGGCFSGCNDFTLLINTAVYLIFKLGFSFAAARYRSIRISGGYILLISLSGFELFIST